MEQGEHSWEIKRMDEKNKRHPGRKLKTNNLFRIRKKLMKDLDLKKELHVIEKSI